MSAQLKSVILSAADAAIQAYYALVNTDRDDPRYRASELAEASRLLEQARTELAKAIAEDSLVTAAKKLATEAREPFMLEPLLERYEAEGRTVRSIEYEGGVLVAFELDEPEDRSDA